MAPEEDDHKDMREVKALLRRLQRVGTHLPPAEAASKNPGGVAPDQESLADRRPAQGRRLAALALAMLAAGTVIVLAGDLFVKYWPRSPSPRQATAISGEATSSVVTIESAGTKISTPGLPIEASQPVPQAGAIDDRAAPSVITTVPANPAIGNAHQLMDGGHIVAGRKMLLQPDLAASQEGAWLLARSYDPNYLATIQSPDASADKGQAEEWYRRWRDIGVRNGMVMDDLRLNRIINSMQ